MISIPFQAGGPLRSNSPLYVRRDADREMLLYLQQMHYIQLTEPRQQGKTSLLYRLRKTLPALGVTLVYVDAESLSNKDEAGWYRDFAARIIDQLRNLICCDNLLIPSDATTWRSFLKNLLQAGVGSDNPNHNLIISVDEVGSIPEKWAEDFFRVLREVYTVREIEADFQRLSFVLVGAFDPRDLIHDIRISPFNIAQRIRIEDLNLAQLKTLVSKLDLPELHLNTITDRLFYWTDGQPYLAQKLCVYLAECEGEMTAETVDQAVDRFFQEDTKHLPRILTDLGADLNLLSYTKHIISHRTKFTPAINPQQFRLAHVIGVIKPDANGYCRIRNRIYEEAFAHLFDRISPPPPAPKHQIRCVDFRLQLTLRDNNRFDVRTLLAAGHGESHCVCELPYTTEELVTLLKAVRAAEYTPADFRLEEVALLEQHKLLVGSVFALDPAKYVGQALYQSLLAGDVREVFQATLRDAKRTKDTVLVLQLRFDEEAVRLAQYPWELLHADNALLRSADVELTRYIAYPDPIPEATIQPPFQLLYIQSRPADLQALNQAEQRKVREQLDHLKSEGVVSVNVLSQPTFEALRDYLDENSVHILHFDGHGVYGKRCLKCGKVNYPRHQNCQIANCHASLNAESHGYLAFETEAGNADWVDNTLLHDLLNKHPLQLAVLSACRTGAVGDETLFSGVAPALIQAGIPAVVSMQLPISETGAGNFLHGFYKRWAKYEARFDMLPLAVNTGRRQLMKTPEWFIPTLYQRSRD